MNTIEEKKLQKLHQYLIKNHSKKPALTRAFRYVADPSKNKPYILSDKETLLFKMAKELEKRGLIKIVNNTVYKDTNIVHLHVIKKIPA